MKVVKNKVAPPVPRGRVRHHVRRGHLARRRPARPRPSRSASSRRAARGSPTAASASARAARTRSSSSRTTPRSVRRSKIACGASWGWCAKPKSQRSRRFGSARESTPAGLDPPCCVLQSASSLFLFRLDRDHGGDAVGAFRLEIDRYFPTGHGRESRNSALRASHFRRAGNTERSARSRASASSSVHRQTSVPLSPIPVSAPGPVQQRAPELPEPWTLVLAHRLTG